MIFKFLEKPIVIDCFVSEDRTYVKENFPIVHSSKFIPEWWKKTPKSEFSWEKMDTNRTVKGCMGIMGTFKNGFIMPLWTDLAIKIDEETQKWNTKFSDVNSKITLHPSSQIPNFYENFAYFKIESPWLIKLNDLKIVVTDPFYLLNRPKPYYMPYGITEGVNSYTQLNFFLMIEKKNINLMIKNNTPMMHIIPITDKSVKLNCEVVSEQEYRKYFGLFREGSSFTTTGFNVLKKTKEKISWLNGK